MKDISTNRIFDIMDVVLVIEAVLLVLVVGYAISRPGAACTEALDVTKGQNFNQPVLTKHNCVAGQVPNNWRALEAK